MSAMDAPIEAVIAAAAGFVFVSLLFAISILLCRRRRPAKPVTGGLPYSARDYESASFDLSLGHISMPELAAATGNFSPEAIVGDGAFGFVYRARFPSGQVVAVKRLSADAAPSQGLREFRAEMETLGRLRHPHLARLLGFCASGPADRLLIYEFLPNGALDQWLYPTAAGDGDGDGNGKALSWPARAKIVRGVAAGLAFLHEECRPRIIHRDIKSSNVLLDAEFEAKVTDFGLARRVDASQSHVSTQAAGTAGYMPPEYRAGATAATAAADVYSFGVLMLEVAAGRRPNLPLRRADGREEGMERWARRAVEEGKGMEILDPGMEIGGLREEEVKAYLHVALRCIDESPRKRPSMGEVVSLLDQLQQQGAN